MVLAVVDPQVLLLDVADIYLDLECQPRVRCDLDVIDEYADHYRSRRSLPPLVVFHVGDLYLLADGWHRFKAALRAGLRKIDVEVHHGTRRDAILYSVGANAEHGLRRSSEDRRRAVEILLKDPDWCQRSNSWIADMARVSHPYVGKVRRELGLDSTPGCNDFNLNQRIGKDGKTYTVSAVSPSPKPAPEPDGLDELTLPDDEPGLDDPDEGDDGPVDDPSADRPDDCDADDGGPVHVSEALLAWIETLPVRPELKGQALVIFDSDAILFRDMRGLVEEFSDRARELLREHDKRGAYHAAVRRFLSLRKPLSWVVCPPQSSGGCGGVGEVCGVRCHACRGRGYRIDGVASQGQIAYLKRLGVEDGAALDPGTASDLIAARKRARREINHNGD